jgi:hypothetical protein
MYWLVPYGPTVMSHYFRSFIPTWPLAAGFVQLVSLHSSCLRNVVCTKSPVEELKLLRSSPYLQNNGTSEFVEVMCVTTVPSSAGGLVLLCYYAERQRSCLGYQLLPCFTESQSEILYDGRFTAIQFVLASSSLRPTTSIFFSSWTLAVMVLM